jgi:hypothetical protein
MESMESTDIRLTYVKCPQHRYTFQRENVRAWVEKVAENPVLNLFSGPTRLACDEIRNDADFEQDADYHMDAKDFLDYWILTKGPKFGTVLLDPPYSLRKSMTKYKGHKVSNFLLIKNLLHRALLHRGIVITFGYHSVSMGKGRGFEQEEILLVGHGGSIHDTIAVSERWIRDPKTGRKL